jgi:tagatose 1,6-diphosphate aldolase
VGLVVAVEATGYTGDETARESEILQGWSVGKIRRMGASALKLLVYYHPESILARKQEDLIAAISEACNKYDLLFFLEPLSYSLDTGKMLNSIEKSKVVINTAERLTSIGIDVLKAEFPLNVEEDPDENHWAEACESLSNASRVPWVLLSAAVNFECYLRQLSIACQNGASGAMAGRAVWKEAVGYHGMKLDSFLRVKAGERLQCITDVCNVLGKPWQKFYPPQATVPRNYYKSYPDL